MFGDISCRRVGPFRLQFNLFDLAKNNASGEHAIYVTSQVSRKRWRVDINLYSLRETASHEGLYGVEQIFDIKSRSKIDCVVIARSLQHFRCREQETNMTRIICEVTWRFQRGLRRYVHC